MHVCTWPRLVNIAKRSRHATFHKFCFTKTVLVMEAWAACNFSYMFGQAAIARPLTLPSCLSLILGLIKYFEKNKIYRAVMNSEMQKWVFKVSTLVLCFTPSNCNFVWGDLWIIILLFIKSLQVCCVFSCCLDLTLIRYKTFIKILMAVKTRRRKIKLKSYTNHYVPFLGNCII